MSSGAVRGALLHAVALAILLWPLVGITFVPMVDLPGHLAITRVLDDYLHGQYRSTLHLNLDPVYKPTYLLLYAVYSVVPKSMVGACAVGVMIVGLYAAVCWSIATLGRRPASSALVVSLATTISLFIYSSAFFWGLLPFLLAVPPALIAYASYLPASGLVDDPAPTRASTVVFLLAALVAHAVHPLSSLFLALVLGPAALVAAARAVGWRGGGPSGATRLARVVGPLVVWIPAVLVLHRLGTSERGEVDVQQSMAAFALPFHGLAAARAFLAQIPVELGLLPTQNPAHGFVSYPVAVALLLLVACAIAVGTASTRRPPVARLAATLVVSALVFLFVRHDIVRVSVGSLWYPVRGSGFLVFFFGVLAAVLLVRALDASRIAGVVSIAVALVGAGLALDRSIVLRTHFVEFDREVGAFFRAERGDRYIRQQAVNYIDHIRTYNCFFDATCPDHRRLFFSIVPNATIYPLSRNRTAPVDGGASSTPPKNGDPG